MAVGFLVNLEECLCGMQRRRLDDLSFLTLRLIPQFLPLLYYRFTLVIFMQLYLLPNTSLHFFLNLFHLQFYHFLFITHCYPFLLLNLHCCSSLTFFSSFIRFSFLSSLVLSSVLGPFLRLSTSLGLNEQGPCDYTSNKIFIFFY